jgi:hypothetical protein
MKYLIILALLQISIIFSGCDNKEIKSTSFAVTVNNDTYSIVRYVNDYTVYLRPFGDTVQPIYKFGELLQKTIITDDLDCSNYTFYKNGCIHYELGFSNAYSTFYQLLNDDPAICKNDLLTLY